MVTFPTMYASCVCVCVFKLFHKVIFRVWQAVTFFYFFMFRIRWSLCTCQVSLKKCAWVCLRNHKTPTHDILYKISYCTLPQHGKRFFCCWILVFSDRNESLPYISGWRNTFSFNQTKAFSDCLQLYFISLLTFFFCKPNLNS